MGPSPKNKITHKKEMDQSYGKESLLKKNNAIYAL
jgi:hypothetical protein